MGSGVHCGGRGRNSMDSADALESPPAPRSLALWLWGFFLVGVPFYVFSDGVPQPAYLLVPIIAVAAIIGRRKSCAVAEHRDLLLVLAMFVLYTFMVSFAWFEILGDIRMLAYPIYYAFNLGLFWLVLFLRAEFDGRFETFTAKAIVCSIALQVALIPVIGTSGLLRQALFFKNPNQLGYYAMLAATVILLARERSRLSLHWLVFGMVGALILGVISLSRSAMMSMALLLLLAFRLRPRLLLLGAVITVTVLALVWIQLPVLARDRLFLMTPEFDDSIAGRGYDRIFNHPAYLLFGAGEGAFGRFESFLQGEIHSTFGTIAFAYGVPGLVLFGVYMAKILRRSGGSSWLLILPALAYGLTHQGLRFTMLWVLFGVACLPRTGAVHDAR